MESKVGLEGCTGSSYHLRVEAMVLVIFCGFLVSDFGASVVV